MPSEVEAGAGWRRARRTIRRAMAGTVVSILAVIVFLGLARGLWTWELLVQRELYHAAEATGILEGGLGMQILGRNIPRPPEWMRWTVTALGLGVGLGPAVLGVLAARRWWRHRWRWRDGRWIGRGLVALLVFTTVATWSERTQADRVQAEILRLGERMGCRCIYVGVLMMTTDGPFVAGPGYRGWNLAWRQGPWALPRGLGFLVALTLDALLTARAARRPGECAACGYDLRGNASGVCPECGARRER